MQECILCVYQSSNSCFISNVQTMKGLNKKIKKNLFINSINSEEITDMKKLKKNTALIYMMCMIFLMSGIVLAEENISEDGISGFSEEVTLKSGMCKADDGTWYYYTDGQIDYEYTGMAKNQYGWYYISNGKYDSDYTGLVKYKSSWVFVKNGRLNTTYTGLVKYKSSWLYVNNGKLDLTYTGLAKNQYGWFYVENGKYDSSYTGMARNRYGWYYVTDGKHDSDYTGMARNKYGWWYITNGKLDLTYTGLARNPYGTWYMQNGKLDMSFSGNVVINDETLAVTNGQVIGSRNFILVGDSYLYGQTPDGRIDSWGVYLSRMLPQYTFDINGIRGAGFGTTVEGKNFLDALKGYSGDKDSVTDILVCGGFNDAHRSLTEDEVIAGMVKFAEYVSENFPNAKLHIGFVGTATDSTILELLDKTAIVYRDCIEDIGAIYIPDMEDTVRDAEYITSDAHHPNQLGQKKIAEKLYGYLTTGTVPAEQ